MKILICGFFILQLFQKSFAQVGVVNNQVEVNSYPGAQVYEIPVRGPALIGSPYLMDNWLIGNVYLKKGGKIVNTPIKYDIQNKQILFRETQRVMMVKLNYVDSFNILRPNGQYYNFVVSRTWKNNKGLDASGVYQSLTLEGDYRLLKKYEVYIIKANYNVALSAGEKDDRYEQKSTLYFLNSDNSEIEEVPRGKKKIGLYFNDERVSSYINTNKPRLKEERGLIELIQYVNSIQNH